MQIQCKVVIYNYVFCWLSFCVKFDCNFIQSFIPCIYCERERECEDSSKLKTKEFLRVARD